MACHDIFFRMLFDEALTVGVQPAGLILWEDEPESLLHCRINKDELANMKRYQADLLEYVNVEKTNLRACLRRSFMAAIDALLVVPPS